MTLESGLRKARKAAKRAPVYLHRISTGWLLWSTPPKDTLQYVEVLPDGTATMYTPDYKNRTVETSPI